MSGLTASKSLGDWGVSYTCFEASDDVGGNWYFRNPNGRSSAYRSLHIDTSKSAISFADFPMDGRYPDFPHHTEIHQFLREYADHFALRDRIRFNTAVEHAQRLEDGGWQVRTGRRRDARVRRAAGLQRPPLESRRCRASRAASTATSSIRITTSTRATRSTCTASA